MTEYIEVALNPPEEDAASRSKDIFMQTNSEGDETVEMENSDDGYTKPDEEKEKEREERYELTKRRLQLAAVFFLMMLFLILLAVIPIIVRKNKHKKGIKGFHVHCNGGSDLTISEWLNQKDSGSASLCDPMFEPPNQVADMNKPVQVFILMGEGNMLGSGAVQGKMPGTLDFLVRAKERFTHLAQHDEDGEHWTARSDVRFVGVDKKFHIYKNESLTVSEEQQYFGPELQFGYVMGELLDSPVLLIKSCDAGRSLGGDLLPPGSPTFTFDDATFAGYGESPRRWKEDTEPEPSKWHGGHQYDTDVSNIKQVLSNLGTYYPGATEYEIAGFLWWQGDSDRKISAYADRYEKNLERLIKSLRKDLDAPDSKFAIATIGYFGDDMVGDTLEVAEAQLAMNSDKRHPEFSGNVRTIDTRSSWRGGYVPAFKGGGRHQDISMYGHNAETVMEVGNALAWTMANLLQREFHEQ